MRTKPLWESLGKIGKNPSHPQTFTSYQGCGAGAPEPAIFGGDGAAYKI